MPSLLSVLITCVNTGCVRLKPTGGDTYCWRLMTYMTPVAPLDFKWQLISILVTEGPRVPDASLSGPHCEEYDLGHVISFPCGPCLAFRDANSWFQRRAMNRYLLCIESGALRCPNIHKACIQKCETLYCVLGDSAMLLEGSRASPSRPSGRASVELKSLWRI
jgi:hypothetical protein